MKKFDKIEKDGKVAVVYSPGYGAGWSTWSNDGDEKALCMDADIVRHVIDGRNDLAASVAKAKYPHTYLGGASSLKVEWVPRGRRFRIDEYDGNESVFVEGYDDDGFFFA